MKKISLVFVLMTALAVNGLSGASDSLYSIPLKDIDGKETTLEPWKGKVILIVNVASKCGYTPQYEGLQKVYEKYGKDGFAVLGFPCNQFGRQEPGTEEEIKEFCSTRFDVTFPMFSKIDVKGADQHPVYKVLSGKDAKFPGDIRWNFGKFLVGKDGTVLERWGSGVKPESDKVTGAIEAALAEEAK